MGIQPESVDNISNYEMEIYTKLIPLWLEDKNKDMENCIKKAVSELMG